MNDIALDVTYIVKKYPYPYNLNLINALIYESRKINIDLLTLFNVGGIVKKVDLDMLAFECDITTKKLVNLFEKKDDDMLIYLKIYNTLVEW